MLVQLSRLAHVAYIALVHVVSTAIKNVVRFVLSLYFYQRRERLQLLIPHIRQPWRVYSFKYKLDCNFVFTSWLPLFFESPTSLLGCVSGVRSFSAWNWTGGYCVIKSSSVSEISKFCQFGSEWASPYPFKK